MAHAGVPGSRTTDAAAPPSATKWALTAPGYRIGVHAGDGAIIEPLEYHPGYLVLTRADLEQLLALLGPARPGR